MTPKQIKYVRALMLKHGIHDQKDEVVMAHTDNRTSHLSDMTYQETQTLIKSLTGGTSPRQRMINKMLSMAHEMQWELPDGRVDMDRINAWCEKYTKLHKPIDKLEDNELPQVVTIFEKAYQSFLKGL